MFLSVNGTAQSYGVIAASLAQATGPRHAVDTKGDLTEDSIYRLAAVLQDSDFVDAVAQWRSQRRRFRRWGLRFYAGAFLTLGLFALAHALRHHETWRIVAKGCAGVVGAVAVTCGVISYGYGVRAKRTARRSGLNP
jgi:hypothetical protein